MAGNADGPPVEHDPAAERFWIRIDGHLARLRYRRRPGQIIFVHTVVPRELQGRGLAERLARTGLEFARAQSLQVIPECPFVAAYIQRHSEFQSLVQHDDKADSV
jgi:predicted GNAT family acetyltransferase